MLLDIPLKYLPGKCFVKEYHRTQDLWEWKRYRLPSNTTKAEEEAVKEMETLKTKMKPFPKLLIFSLGLPTYSGLAGFFRVSISTQELLQKILSSQRLFFASSSFHSTNIVAYCPGTLVEPTGLEEITEQREPPHFWGSLAENSANVSLIPQQDFFLHIYIIYFSVWKTSEHHHF